MNRKLVRPSSLRVRGNGTKIWISWAKGLGHAWYRSDGPAVIQMNGDKVWHNLFGGTPAGGWIPYYATWNKNRVDK